MAKKQTTLTEEELMLADEASQDAIVEQAKAETHPPMPERFNTGGATADERAAWIAANGG